MQVSPGYAHHVILTVPQGSENGIEIDHESNELYNPDWQLIPNSDPAMVSAVVTHSEGIARVVLRAEILLFMSC